MLSITQVYSSYKFLLLNLEWCLPHIERDNVFMHVV